MLSVHTSTCTCMHAWKRLSTVELEILTKRKLLSPMYSFNSPIYDCMQVHVYVDWAIFLL